VALDVEEVVRDLVAPQEVLHVVAGRDHLAPITPDAVERGGAGRSPVSEQVVEDRVERVLGRVPGLQQVVVEADLVDRLDRRIGVRVRRQQDLASLGEVLTRPQQELGARHLRHPLVDEEQGDIVPPEGQLLDGDQTGDAPSATTMR
jgi:hypothetical protein